MRVIGKNKIAHVEFDEFMDRTFEYVELRFKHNAPLLHKILYKCPADEMVLTRRLLSIIPGYLLSKFLLGLFDFLVPKWIVPALFHSYGNILLTLVFVLSVRARVILSLLTLILLVNLGGIFIYLGLFRTLFRDVVPNIFDNMIALIKMQHCLMLKYFWEKGYMLNMGVKPITEILLMKDATNFKQFFQKLTNKQQELKDMLNTELKPVLEKDFDCQSLCQNKIIEEKCKDSIYKISPIFPGFVSNKACGFAIPKFCDRFCSNMDEYKQEERKKINSLFNDSLSILDNEFGLIEDQNKAGKEFYGHIAEKAVKLWPMFQDVNEDVHNRLRWGKFFISIVSILVHVLYIVAFLLAARQSAVYLKKYLNFLNFDNLYIDRYFRHLDQRRKNAGKIHLLPMRKVDGLPIMTTWSLSKSYFEKSEQKLRTLVVIFCLGIIFCLVYLNQIFFDLTDLMEQELRYADHDSIMVHLYIASCEGGLLAGILQKFVKMLNFIFVDSFRQEMSDCAIPVQPNPWRLYEDLIQKCCMILLVHFITPHLRRFRHLICDFYFYRQSKRRALFLYNRQLKIRLRFMKIRMFHLEKIIKMQRLFAAHIDPVNRIITPAKSSPGFFGRFRKKQKRCFICQQVLKKPFVWCDKFDNEPCGVVYCRHCAEDIQNKCIACSPPSVSGTSSSTTRPSD